VAASGNLNPQGVSMFEPIHGSAPRYRGQGKINPIAAIAAASMMLDHIGETRGGQLIEEAIRNVLASGKIKDLSAGKMGYTTSEVGDMIAAEVRRLGEG